MIVGSLTAGSALSAKRGTQRRGGGPRSTLASATCSVPCGMTGPAGWAEIYGTTEQVGHARFAPGTSPGASGRSSSRPGMLSLADLNHIPEGDLLPDMRV
jgi:hypothetical protein